MKLSDFFKIVEDKHMPDDVLEMRNEDGELLARVINIGKPIEEEKDDS